MMHLVIWMWMVRKGEKGSEDLMNVGHGRQDEEKVSRIKTSCPGHNYLHAEDR